MNRAEASARIKEILSMYVSTTDPREFDLLPKKLTAGKLYEAYALTLVTKQLATVEGFQLSLMNGQYLPLKSSPSGINRRYPHIQLSRGKQLVAELWTDIEFLSLSYLFRPLRRPPTKGEFHELDIVIVEPGIAGKPRNDQVWLGVECKNTGYEKGLLKEILGVRRELSLLTDDQPTHFRQWPRKTVPCTPASCLLVYASDSGVAEYSSPGEVFGIDFFFEELAI